MEKMPPNFLRKPWNSGHACVKLRGADVLDWLQGQITNDVRLLNESTELSFCICSPNGMIQGLGTLIEVDGEIFSVMDPASAEVLVERVRDFVILEEVSAEVVDPGDSQFSPSPVHEKARLRALEPRFSVDILPKTIPNDLREPFFSRHVSMTKGCYTGQEIVHRVHSLGKPKRGWFVLEGNSCERGADITDADGLSVGSITSVGGEHGNMVAGGWIAISAIESGLPLLVTGEPVKLLTGSGLNA